MPSNGWQRIPMWGILALLCWAASAQEVRFEGQVIPNEVEVGQPFKVRFSYNHRGRFTPPEFSDFEVLAGPNTSTRMEWINGAMSWSHTVEYILRGRRPGSFRIGRARLDVGRNAYYTSPLTVTIRASSPSVSSPNGTSPPSADSDSIPDVFIRAVVTKRSLYEGEGVGVAYYLYTRLPIQDYAITHRPPFSEFFAYEVPVRNPKVQETQIGKHRYRYVKLYEAVVFPLKSGRLKIPSLKVDAIALLPQRVVRRYRSPFADFFGDDPFFRQFFEDFEQMWEDYAYQQRLLHLKSEPLVLHVLPLPVKGRPADFSGIVGRFSMDVSFDSTRIGPGSAATLKVRLRGEGNIKMVDLSSPDLPAGFEVYPSQASEEYRVSNGKVRGWKEFRFLVEARQPGDYQLPPIHWSYFDPTTERYVTLRSDSIRIRVRGTPFTDSTIASTPPPQNDILPIEESVSKWYSMSELAIPHGWWRVYGISVVVIILAGGLIVWGRQRYVQQGGLWRDRHTSRIAAIRRAAHRALNQGNANEFFRHVNEGFEFLFEWKLGLPPARLTSDRLQRRLLQVLPFEEASRVVSLWTTVQAEAIRPTVTGEQLRQWWENIRRLWTRLEKINSITYQHDSK